MNHATLTALTELDPAPGTSPSDAEGRRRDAMLERILATPQVARADRPTRRPVHVGRRIAIAGLVAAVAVPAAVLGAHTISRQLDPTSHGLSDADLAGWVSTTTPRSASQLSAGAKRWCIDATDLQAGSDASVRIAGGDQRGRVASMIIRRGDYTDICLADLAGGGGAWELASAPDSPLPPVEATEVLLQSEGSHGSDDIGTAWGQAGADVRAVTLHLGTRDVQTVVVDGLWNAWWPSAQLGDGLPKTATVTYSNGRTATVPVVTP